MFVGVLRLSFHLPGARSLKDKRMTVRSFRDRVRGKLDVSIAEVEDQNLVQRATFGVAVVSSDASVCDEVLAAVASMANNVRDAILVDRATEIVSMGQGREFGGEQRELGAEEQDELGADEQDEGGEA